MKKKYRKWFNNNQKEKRTSIINKVIYDILFVKKANFQVNHIMSSATMHHEPLFQNIKSLFLNLSVSFMVRNEGIQGMIYPVYKTGGLSFVRIMNIRGKPTLEAL